MPLVEIRELNALTDNKPFLINPSKINKDRMKNFLRYQETMIIQQEIY